MIHVEQAIRRVNRDMTLMWALHALLETHHSTDILLAEALPERLGQYPLLVIPEATRWSELLREQLQEYMQAGGHVIASGAHLAHAYPHLVGADKSEIILGAAVRQMQKRRAAGGPEFYVSTKSNKPDAATVRSECERSLERLGVERIDFYHIWCVRTWAEWEQRKAGGAVREFHKLKDEGLVRHVVVSHHLGSEDTKRLLAEAEVEGMLLGFNSTNWQYRLGGIEDAGRRRRGVMVMNPLGGGVLWQVPERFEYLKRRPGDDLVRGSEERRVGKECRSRWSPYH